MSNKPYLTIVSYEASLIKNKYCPTDFFEGLLPLEFKIISMSIQNNLKTEEDYNVFTIRFNPEMQQMVEYLSSKKMINKSSVIRLAVAELYDQQKRLDGD